MGRGVGGGEGGWALIIEIIMFKRKKETLGKGRKRKKERKKKPKALPVSSLQARGNGRGEPGGLRASAAGPARVCNSRRGAKAASAPAPAAAQRAVAAGGEEKMGHCPSDQSI